MAKQKTPASQAATMIKVSNKQMINEHKALAAGKKPASLAQMQAKLKKNLGK